MKSFKKIVAIMTLCVMAGTMMVGNMAGSAYAKDDSNSIEENYTGEYVEPTNLELVSLVGNGNTGDGTLLCWNNKTIIVDLSEKAYFKFEDLKLKDKKSYTIDYFVITHSHQDHVSGLDNLVNWTKSGNKLVIKELYLNAVYAKDGVAVNKVNQLLKCKNITIEKLYLVGAYQGKAITANDIGINCPKTNKITQIYSINDIQKRQIKQTTYCYFLPALKEFTGDTATINENNSSMAVVYHNPSKKYKVILAGDMQGKALVRIATGVDSDVINPSSPTKTYQEYTDLFNHVNGYKLYYKVTHHGKRAGDAGAGFKNREAKFLSTFYPDYIIGTIWGNDNYKDSKLNYITGIIQNKSYMTRSNYTPYLFSTFNKSEQ